ncbi:aminotransferase class V-fold PLP-dependent enzyme [uncultured Nonlabens sp.]|uniref:aminotransferase class V-fold PLP-dependent enzyme n=1 Tax=uncultured Nonlabens sp. TaxID=859306 RepID=UPI00260F2D6C|nr:aminotransferase class V-fold PLP-dependent enzyme [uncultured Nonlabens sp.]
MIDQFPILKEYTYLNTANHGLLSQDIVDYRASLDLKMRDQASLFTNNRNVFIDEVRHTIANFMDADADFTAVIPNFSTAFNTLINSIDATSSFLLLKEDYPSINNPVEARGFKTHHVGIDEQMEQNIRAVCEKEQPDFFCFSMVQYISGIKMDLDFLNDLKKRFPKIILIADFTQYVGFEEFRFRESGIDTIIASCYKWLHAGDGNGFICMKEEVQEVIFPIKNLHGNANSGIKSNVNFISTFEPGHQDMMAFGTLQQAIIKVHELGWKTMSEPVKKLALKAKLAFQERELLSTVVCARKNHSSIFNIKGDQELYDKLLEHKIVTSLRGDGLRISFSYFNTEEDLIKLLNVLDL